MIAWFKRRCNHLSSTRCPFQKSVPEVRSKVPKVWLRLTLKAPYFNIVSKRDPSKIIELVVLLSSSSAKRFWFIETKKFRNGFLLLSQCFDNRTVDHQKKIARMVTHSKYFNWSCSNGLEVLAKYWSYRRCSTYSCRGRHLICKFGGTLRRQISEYIEKLSQSHQVPKFNSVLMWI